MDNNLIYKVAIIGAGQSGLAASYFLQKEGIAHIVLEQHKIGHSWTFQRWDSFKMNTPNWMTGLPGLEFSGEKRAHFMNKNEFTAYMNRYAAQFDLPVSENQKVVRIEKENDEYSLTLESKGHIDKIKAKTVVIASGMMNQVKFPELAKKVPKSMLQLHASEYKNPEALPEGDILVVGGGQSGCQIAEELALSGKHVYLASSKVPRAPRRYKGRDVMEWMDRMGVQDITAAQLRENPKLNGTQPQSSGMGTLGHTISYQSLHQLGVTILGSLKNIDSGTFYFAGNAKENISFADHASAKIKENVDSFLLKHPELDSSIREGEDRADLPDVHFAAASDLSKIEKSKLTTMIWATGFNYSFPYLDAALLDDKGVPKHIEGVMPEKGLFCIGFPWLRKKKSGLVYGVTEDAKVIVEKIIEMIKP